MSSEPENGAVTDEFEMWEDFARQCAAETDDWLMRFEPFWCRSEEDIVCNELVRRMQQTDDPIRRGMLKFFLYRLADEQAREIESLFAAAGRTLDGRTWDEYP